MRKVNVTLNHNYKSEIFFNKSHKNKTGYQKPYETATRDLLISAR